MASQSLESGCLGIVHVPKCGGSAVRSALVQLPGSYAGPLYFDADHFGTPELLDAVPEPSRRLIAGPAELAALVGGHRLVMGHYSARSLLNAGCTKLAVMVREPRSRILSLYRFWQSQPLPERATWGLWGTKLVAQAQLPFDRFVANSDLWPAIGNSMARQLAGSVRASRLSTRGVSRHLAIVEWSSASAVFVERIAESLASPAVHRVERENVTEVAGDEMVLDRMSLERLDRLTRHDRRLLFDLGRRGLLTARRVESLDREFRDTAERLGFRVAAGRG